MTHDISDFERQLGRELKAAGYRRLQARNSDLQDRRWRPVALTAAVAAATLVAVLAFAGLRPPAATAHPFKIVYLEDEIRLDVIDVVEDPRSAERELQDELGVDVEFVARPAPLSWSTKSSRSQAPEPPTCRLSSVTTAGLRDSSCPAR